MRKSALQLLSAMLSNNPFAAKVHNYKCYVSSSIIIYVAYSWIRVISLEN